MSLLKISCTGATNENVEFHLTDFWEHVRPKLLHCRTLHASGSLHNINKLRVTKVIFFFFKALDVIRFKCAGSLFCCTAAK